MSFDDSIAEKIKTSLAEIPHPSLPKGPTSTAAPRSSPPTTSRGGRELLHAGARDRPRIVGQLRRRAAGHQGAAQGLRVRPLLLRARFDQLPGHPRLPEDRRLGVPPGEQNINDSLATFIAEGGTVFCCRFGLALHGGREEDLIEGVIPAHPLDVQDALIYYARKGAIVNSTYMV